MAKFNWPFPWVNNPETQSNNEALKLYLDSLTSSGGNSAPIVPLGRFAGVWTAATGGNWQWLTPVGATADLGTHAGADVFEVRAADLARSGLTTHIRLRVTAFANLTTPATTFTCRCYSFTQSGGAPPIFTRNVQQGGSVTVPNPPAAGTSVAELDLGVIPDGNYGIAAIPPGAPAASSGTLLVATVEAVYV